MSVFGWTKQDLIRGVFAGSVLSRLAGGQITVVGPSTLHPALAVVRSQPSGARATAVGSDGITLAEYAADTPRFAGTAGRLRVEGARTNSIPNARAEGGTNGVLGSGGAYPSGWTANGALPGTLTITTAQSLAGVNGITLRIVRDGSEAASGYAVQFTGTTVINAAPSDVWASAFNVAITGSPPAGITYRHEIIGRDNVGASVTANTFRVGNFTPDATGKRYSVAQALTSDATIARITSGLRFDFPATTACDFTVALSAPQLELAAFASTPILAVSGTPAASTRGADGITAPLSSFGISASGAMTLLASVVVPQATPAGVNQTLVQVDDGSNSNRFGVRNNSASALQSLVVLAGASTLGSPGSFTAGTRVRLGLTYDGAGRLAVSVDGAAAVVVTGGPTGGLTTLRLGAAAAAGAELFGDIGSLSVRPGAVSDVQLAAQTAAIP